MIPDANNAKGWVGMLMPLLERGGPVVALLLLLVGTLHGWYLMREIGRMRTNMLTMYTALEACKDAQLKYVERFAACHCEPRH